MARNSSNSSTQPVDESITPINGTPVPTTPNKAAAEEPRPSSPDTVAPAPCEMTKAQKPKKPKKAKKAKKPSPKNIARKEKKAHQKAQYAKSRAEADKFFKGQEQAQKNAQKFLDAQVAKNAEESKAHEPNSAQSVAQSSIDDAINQAVSNVKNQQKAKTEFRNTVFKVGATLGVFAVAGILAAVIPTSSVHMIAMTTVALATNPITGLIVAGVLGIVGTAYAVNKGRQYFAEKAAANTTESVDTSIIRGSDKAAADKSEFANAQPAATMVDGMKSESDIDPESKPTL